jgi:hypothetical protein
MRSHFGPDGPNFGPSNNSLERTPRAGLLIDVCGQAGWWFWV